VTDAGLQYVRGMTKLRKLSIGNTQVTDRGLDHLRALKSLEELALDYTRVTDVGIKALKAALPTLRVIQQSRTEALDLEKERYSREPLRIRIRASAAGELADDGIEVGDRTFRDIGALHGMIHRVARKVGESLEVILEADPSLNFTVLQKLQDAIARAGVKKVRVSSSTGDSAVNMEAVKWNTTGFEATYNILDQSFDAASQRMTWTLETKPRAYAWYGYHAVLYNARGQRVLEDAPFFWSTGRRSGRNVEIASLDLRWIARRLRGTANIAAVAEIAVERYPNRPLGGAKSSDSQAPTQIVTGQLPDAATWDHKSLEGLYSISEVAYDETNQTITWVLETKQRFYAAQIYHVVFHDKSGVPLHPDAPLIWSTGQRDNRPVEIATLDLGYIVELLGARTSDVAVVSVERYRDQ
jgi:hypothetical protein